jgi:hypothetical protein
MRHVGLAALAIFLLPAVAMAGDHGRFNLFLGFGGGGFGFTYADRFAHVGFRGDYVAYPRYIYAPPAYCDSPVVVVPAPMYCPPPVVYAPPPQVYYPAYYPSRYCAPSGYYYTTTRYYYSR